jgi:hypothetical protein
MGNDQAARLRRMVRDARRVALVDTGAPLVALLAVEPSAGEGRLNLLATQLRQVAKGQGVPFAEPGSESPGGWRLVTGLDTKEVAEGSLWERAATVLLVTTATSSKVLATYSLLKAQHQLGPLPPVHILFQGAREEEAQRAFESLRATCERFLAWEALDWGIWHSRKGGAGLAEVLATLQMRLPQSRGSEATNSLAAPAAKAV